MLIRGPVGRGVPAIGRLRIVPVGNLIRVQLDLAFPNRSYQSNRRINR